MFNFTLVFLKHAISSTPDSRRFLERILTSAGQAVK